MKRVAPLIVLGTLSVATPASLGTSDSHRPPRQLHRAAAPTPAPAPIETAPTGIRSAKQGQMHLFIPEACDFGPEVDLVVHFHGAPPSLQRSLAESGLHAAVAVENLGTISQDYSSVYTLPGRFEDVTRRALTLVERACPGQERHVGRLALSAWSAGYAAVGALLSRDEVAEQVDAVLLSDGLHAPYLHPNTRQMAPGALGGFIRFAQRAVEGDRMMAITHSAIPTSGYASTTESSSYLLAQLGLERIVYVPAVGRSGMSLESEAKAGNLTVEGYAGGDEAAHASHLHSMGHTLFLPLRRRWSDESTRPPSTAAAP